ncbi:zn-finger domain-containing protein [Gigaspora margarita]|uniref:Zn-finger domain-containing protein n=1 Tax=Gigaspora margarita TaxID=4874 RepID=A0A8H4EUX5_GIGMA|nr:zn-finger domain-containing protein [Gigaspora margarita]
MSKYFSTAEDVPVFGKNNGYSSKTSKKILFKNINFSNPVQNINLESNIANLSNDNDLSKNLQDMSFELEDNTYSKNLEVNPNTNVLDEFENILQGYRELSDDISVSTDYLQNNSFDDETQEYDKFSNEAYADLMVLVTKYKLSNAAGNVIISFFNKHSNNSKSPLPKNIKQGKLFINNMKSNLSYKKTKNGKENIYKEQNNGEWWKTTQSTLPTCAKILSIILYSDATNCDLLGKS